MSKEFKTGGPKIEVPLKDVQDVSMEDMFGEFRVPEIVVISDEEAQKEASKEPVIEWQSDVKEEKKRSPKVEEKSPRGGRKSPIKVEEIKEVPVERKRSPTKELETQMAAMNIEEQPVERRSRTRRRAEVVEEIKEEPVVERKKTPPKVEEPVIERKASPRRSPPPEMSARQKRLQARRQGRAIEEIKEEPVVERKKTPPKVEEPVEQQMSARQRRMQARRQAEAETKVPDEYQLTVESEHFDNVSQLLSDRGVDYRIVGYSFFVKPQNRKLVDEIYEEAKRLRQKPVEEPVKRQRRNRAQRVQVEEEVPKVTESLTSARRRRR